MTHDRENRPKRVSTGTVLIDTPNVGTLTRKVTERTVSNVGTLTRKVTERTVPVDTLTNVTERTVPVDTLTQMRFEDAGKPEKNHIYI